ncbi:MAG: alkaline phosphatase family protein [Marmoricola sp.]
MRFGRIPRSLLWASLALLIGIAAAVPLILDEGDAASPIGRVPPPGPGIHHIQHIVMIMQENRSFDNYFGTYPGADGIPMIHGHPVACVPAGRHQACQRPFVDHKDRDGGGPHAQVDAVGDVNGGRMNGFVQRVMLASRNCANLDDPACTNAARSDVMGYHTGSDIPNYWTYAHDFVLQDHMFEPDNSWSLPSHLFMVSEWAAHCGKHNDPSSCFNFQPKHGLYLHRGLPNQQVKDGTGQAAAPIYAWTDLTYLLHKGGISWGYYITVGGEPDCEDAAAVSCPRVSQNATTPGIWNPLPYFDTVRADQQEGNIQTSTDFLRQARTGTLPAVSWVVPSNLVSEHPPARISVGQSYVTNLVNAIMSGPDWRSTAIFISWDDWGGFYDHVVPPTVDQNGYGLRVPGLLISPYARRGFIDHQILSFDAFAKFIEDDFLHGQRLDPATDGRADPRPDVRENEPTLGNLISEFDFHQKPRPPVLLPVYPKTTLIR